MKSRTLLAETKALQALQAQIDAARAALDVGRTLSIACGHFSVSGITRAVKAPARGKADFILVARETPELFITHKASGFCWNGYGSGGSKAYQHRSPYHDPVIWAFARWAADYCLANQRVRFVERGFFEWVGPERGIWCVPPARIQNLIVYGPEFGGQLGPSNCHIAAVGPPTLTPHGNAFRLRFGDSTTSNAEVPTDGDLPIIAIGGRIGVQQHRYHTHPDRGFFGWLGFFPYRLIQRSAETAHRRKGRPGKGDNLVQVEWPDEVDRLADG
ncbi:MAG: hypothetical protein ACRDKS_18125 [Actinomycetota bacterium]